MQLAPVEVVIAMLWVSTVFIVGIARNLNSFSGGTSLAGLAVVPPHVTTWRCNEPRRTMSENIQEALR